jgi:beta-glucosidase
MSLRTAAGLVLSLLVAAPVHPQGATADSQAFLEQNTPSKRKPDDAARVRALLAKMTLREKVGQMTQLTLAAVSDGSDDALKFDREKLRKAILEDGVSSILNVNGIAMPASWWRERNKEIQAVVAESRLKIPVVYGLDSIHGATYVAGSTLFPQPLGMAASWNPELMLEGSRIAAAETRAAGVAWNFSPVLDVGRQPLWPRLYETFGEDPYLATVLGVAAVRGYEGGDPGTATSVGSSLKHYIGYSFPTNGHDRTPALIPDTLLREIFLPPFAAAVKAGALSVMVNSGDVNGVPGHFNKHLLIDVLRGELGFDGVAVSDWEDIRKAVTIHRAAPTEKEATRIAVLAGIDMSMVPNDVGFATLLQELVKEGAVPMARIDQAVTRILTMKLRMGLFDDPLRGTAAPTEVGSAASRAVALEAARQSIVLLKNEGNALPLAASAKVFVTGPTADSLLSLNNGWTITWQGDRPELYPKDRLTVLGALRARAGAANVSYVPGASFDKELDIAAAATAAAAADVAIVCLGESAYAETPGNIDDLALPEAQLKLAKAVQAAGKPVILVLLEGRPRLVRTIVDGARGVVLGLNPGHEGGRALADVLYGDVNPSGKLPITYPRFANALLTYDHKGFEDQDTGFGLKAYTPEFAFGAGLSYTTFEYSDLKVTPAAAGAPVDVKVTVKNTGARAGAEVVQVYVTDQYASLAPPVKRLRRFARVELKPGESRTLAFSLDRAALSFVDASGKWVLEPGVFTVRVAGLNQDFEIKK